MFERLKERVESFAGKAKMKVEKYQEGREVRGQKKLEERVQKMEKKAKRAKIQSEKYEKIQAAQQEIDRRNKLRKQELARRFRPVVKVAKAVIKKTREPPQRRGTRRRIRRKQKYYVKGGVAYPIRGQKGRYSHPQKNKRSRRRMSERRAAPISRPSMFKLEPSPRNKKSKKKIRWV